MKKSNNPLLYPLSWLYGLGVGLRNFLFNQGILKQQSYPIPLICVGNITVGGTGKDTPMSSYSSRSFVSNIVSLSSVVATSERVVA